MDLSSSIHPLVFTWSLFSQSMLTVLGARGTQAGRECFQNLVDSEQYAAAAALSEQLPWQVRRAPSLLEHCTLACALSPCLFIGSILRRLPPAPARDEAQAWRGMCSSESCLLLV